MSRSGYCSEDIPHRHRLNATLKRQGPRGLPWGTLNKVRDEWHKDWIPNQAPLAEACPRGSTYIQVSHIFIYSLFISHFILVPQGSPLETLWSRSFTIWATMVGESFVGGLSGEGVWRVLSRIYFVRGDVWEWYVWWVLLSRIYVLRGDGWSLCHSLIVCFLSKKSIEILVMYRKPKKTNCSWNLHPKTNLHQFA